MLARDRFAVYRILSEPGPAGGKIRFFRFGIPLVLKVSYRLRSTESDALRFLSNALDKTRYEHLLEIPRLVDCYSDPLTGHSFTLMTRIEGETLFQARTSMSQEQLREVYQTLETFLRNVLWKIPQPAEIAGQVMRSTSGHGIPDPVCFREDIVGPFASTLHCYVYLAGYGYCPDGKELPSEFVKEVSQQVRDVLAADDVVFSHYDLRPYNIIVRDGRLAGIVDWEDSGWVAKHWLLHIFRDCVPCNGPPFTDYWRAQTFEAHTEAAFAASFSLLRYYF
ncbi:hypothetical protein VKT23_019062 [Stygiomarasmius scandens]|uniref:Aminoglycoside phosphotransferase domain-containing protein n=1 Tax=Marasmiellus scandens TaxID=2682957 RepID=A0ABR1IME6_9AGAR